MKYSKKQIEESIKFWESELKKMDEADVPVVSSIKEFLNICKEKGLEAKKSTVSKQGKVISAEIADKDKKIKSREGMETAKKGDLIVADGDNTFYAVPAEKISEYYELDKDGNSITGDNTKWKKIAKELEYYITPFDVDVKVQWQDEPLHATKGYALVCNDKDGKDLSPVAPEVFGDKTLWIRESKKMKYTKKQITEAIAHWTKVLESLDEADDGSEYSVSNDKGDVTITLPKKVDTSKAPEFKEILEREAKEAKSITIDFKDCTYFGGGALNPLLQLLKQMNGKDLVLANVSKDVKELFEMTGFDSVFTFK